MPSLHARTQFRLVIAHATCDSQTMLAKERPQRMVCNSQEQRTPQDWQDYEEDRCPSRQPKGDERADEAQQPIDSQCRTDARQ